VEKSREDKNDIEGTH